MHTDRHPFTIGRACKVVGWSSSGSRLEEVYWRPKALLPMTECIFQRGVESMNADIEKRLDGVPVPSHLLLLYHALRNDLVDYRFDEASRDLQPITVTISVR